MKKRSTGHLVGSVLVVSNNERPTVEEDSVTVVPYDAAWSSLYAAEAPRVCNALGSMVVECEHIGSTAVPGLWAKPIIDILIGANRSEPPGQDQLSAMAALGSVYLGEDGHRPGRFFFRRRDGGLYNVSVVPHDGRLWHDTLTLRNYLRTTPEAVNRYSAVKRHAAAVHPTSLLGYQGAKRVVVEELKTAARSARRD